jgi:hypothetical protein
MAFKNAMREAEMKRMVCWIVAVALLCPAAASSS